MSVSQRAVLSAIRRGARDAKAVAKSAAMPVAQARATIQSLLFAGAIASGPSGYYLRG